MKILVGIKRVIDYTVHIRVKADGSGVETQNVKMSMNPFDAIALEEAIRLKEKNILSEAELEIIIVSIGNKDCQETLRQGLAMGADRAILIETEKTLEPLNIAKIFQKISQKENPTLILLGKQAIDDDCNQTGQMLAGLLNWPQGTFISKLNIENNQAIVMREIDGGLETLSLNLPAVITTDLRLNEPRYISLPNIMQAKRKALELVDINQLEIDLRAHTEILNISEPPKRKQGVILNSVEELIDKLTHEAKIL
jgi:electron transfer flavoprotein beta subunit